jgi:DegV family protein with EDD domain
VRSPMSSSPSHWGFSNSRTARLDKYAKAARGVTRVPDGTSDPWQTESVSRILVVTDSACDLRPEQTEELGIRVVPLTIRFGDEELVDREQLSPKEFWDRVVTGPVIPQTAAPSPGAFQEVFESAAGSDFDGVVCINLSSRVSATYQAARTAADAVSGDIRVEVIDSLTLTMGLGLLVIEASSMAAAGSSLDEVVAGVNDARERVHVYGVVGGLDFLRKGGRIGGASHLVGSLLSIKPVLDVRDGAVEVDSKQRTQARALRYLASKALEAGPLDRLALADGLCPETQEVAEMLRDVDTQHPLEVSVLGPVVGSHAGPGTVGLCYIQARK